MVFFVFLSVPPVLHRPITKKQLFPILFPLLFQKNFDFFEIHPILSAKSMGTKK